MISHQYLPIYAYYIIDTMQIMPIQSDTAQSILYSFVDKHIVPSASMF